LVAAAGYVAGANFSGQPVWFYATGYGILMGGLFVLADKVFARLERHAAAIRE
jgi:hypothetical protein